MKIGIFNNILEIFDDEILGRPFSFNKDRCEFTNNYNECDYILGWLDFRNCESDYNKIIESEIFEKHSHKFIFMSMQDDPQFAYRDKKSIKLLSQPIHNDINKEFNIITYPIQMRHFELEISRDKEFIEELRSTSKEYDFIFIGNLNLPSRQFLRDLKLEKFYTRPAISIWELKTVDERIPVLKDFYRDMARSKFAFAPRGVGSSSFRLYQSLMVGTIPIIFDMIEYPFENKVDWDSFSIRNLSKGSDFGDIEVDYESMRKRSIEFWDEWVDMEKSDRKLYDILKIKLEKYENN